jgi:hypothetical protein
LLSVSLISALALGVTSQVAYAAPTPPPATTSRYAGDLTNNLATDYNRFYTYGYAQGQARITGIVILDFAGQDSQNGQMGTTNWANKFHADADIESAAEGYVKGYYDAQIMLGPPYNSIDVGIGTNSSGPVVTYAGGLDWAGVVNTVATWVMNNTNPNVLLLPIVGADDIEPGNPAGGWKPPAAVEQWAAGFSSSPAGLNYFDFGSADGCPTHGTGQGPPGPCNWGWTQNDIYQVSWLVSTALPLPEIYTTDHSNAQQWQQISLYGYDNNPGGILYFWGAQSQLQAWNQRCAPLNPLPPPCIGVNNPPADAWRFLYDAVNCDGTLPCPTAPGIPASQVSDFMWD